RCHPKELVIGNSPRAALPEASPQGLGLVPAPLGPKRLAEEEPVPRLGRIAERRRTQYALELCQVEGKLRVDELADREEARAKFCSLRREESRCQALAARELPETRDIVGQLDRPQQVLPGQADDDFWL